MNGVSDEASVVSEHLRSAAAHCEESFYLFGAKAQLIEQIEELVSDCALEDWDGYGALPVGGAVVKNAIAFVRSLPNDVMIPEVSPEPDGEISFDWLPDKRRTISVSVGSGLRLAYAWIEGADRGHATARFDGGAMPERLLVEIKRITSHGPSIRAA